MTVNSTTNRVSYTGNGTANPLAVSFPFQAQSDLLVIATVIATGVQTTKVLNTDYTVTGTPDANGFYPNGGAVVPASSVPSSTKWTIIRDPALTQLVQHVDNDPVPAASLDNPVDKLTMIAQRLKDRADRSISIPDGDPVVTLTVPDYVTRAGYLFAWDASGNAANSNFTEAQIASLLAGVPDPTTSLQVFTSVAGSLALADAAADALGGQLVIDTNTTLAGNVSLATKNIRFAGGQILGTGDLTFDEATLTAPLGVTIFGPSVTVKGTILGPICWDWWGTTSVATSDSATSDACNACLTYIAQSGHRDPDIFATKKTYYLSDPIVKASSSYCPRFRMNGAQFYYDFFDEAALEIIGGSGSIAGGLVENFSCVGTTAGTPTGLGIIVDGQCGVRITNFKMENLAWGIVPYNRISGGFTEFVTWDNGHFADDCLGAWWYRIGGGNASFHGTGPTGNIQIDDPAARSDPNVVVDDGALVYNAPCNFQVFSRNTKATIRVGTGCYFFVEGHVTYEAFSGTPTLCSATSPNCAIVGGFGPGLSCTPLYGDIVPMHDMGITAGGVVHGFQKPRRLLDVVLPEDGGAVAIPHFRNSDFLLSLSLVATNYTYKYLLSVGADAAGANSVTILGNPRSANGAGYGAPTFSYSTSTGLTITNTNYPAATVEARIAIVDLGGFT